MILKRTKDTEKCTNLQEAIDVFSAWLDDYKTHSRSKENLGYLPLDTVKTFRSLAEEEGVLPKADKGRPIFLDVYEEAEGDVKKLRVKKVNMLPDKNGYFRGNYHWLSALTHSSGMFSSADVHLPSEF